MAAMDYARGTTFMQLCNDDICSVPEFTGVAIRMNRPVSDVIIGMEENDPAADAAIAEWCSIAKVRHDLRRARIGLMGRVLDTMLDMQTDPAAVTAAFGAHAVPCEPDSILRDFLALDEKDPGVVDMLGTAGLLGTGLYAALSGDDSGDSALGQIGDATGEVFDSLGMDTSTNCDIAVAIALSV